MNATITVLIILIVVIIYLIYDIIQKLQRSALKNNAQAINYGEGIIIGTVSAAVFFLLTEIVEILNTFNWNHLEEILLLILVICFFILVIFFILFKGFESMSEVK